MKSYVSINRFNVGGADELFRQYNQISFLFTGNQRGYSHFLAFQRLNFFMAQQTLDIMQLCLAALQKKIHQHSRSGVSLWF